MKASVIIATYGRDSYLINTIRSVLQQDYPDFELLIIDQTKVHDPEVEAFVKNLSDPRYSYYLVTPPSLPGARNFGLSKARGDIVIYVDDDVLLDSDFIQIHIQAYERAGRVGGVGGRVRIPKRILCEHLPRILKDGSWTGGLDFPDEGETISTVGCNMSFRRSALNEIGGFDVSFEGNALREESDVCFRLRRHGYQVWYEPKAGLDHLVAPTGGCRVKDLRDVSTYYQNEALFHLKNFGLRHFCSVFFLIFINHVWPHKRSLKFWSRLGAYSEGVLKGMKFTLFPKKLELSVIWSLNPTGGIQTSPKVST